MHFVIPFSFWIGLAALLGGMVGSFLNVCIYRLPRGLSVWKPSRSFCPGCRKGIPWWRNIPVFSWLILRARCPDCGCAIAPRYLVVEVLTAVLFGWIAWGFGAGLDQASLLLVCAYSTLASLLLVATFVDLEHFIIPDEVSLGGVALGLIWSTVVPSMHAEASVLGGGIAGLIGAVSGYGILWLVVEGGRMAFGRRRLRFVIPAQVEWVRSGEEACLKVDGESMEWGEFFFRGTESLQMRAVDGDCDGVKLGEGLWKWSLNSLQAGAQKFDLNLISRISGRIVELVIPREVMGFGDVKLLAAIGAFLGWRGVLFALFAGATIGSVVGVVGALMARREWSARIPFGPYLALGAMLWLAAGPACLRWYWEVLGALLPKAG